MSLQCVPFSYTGDGLDNKVLDLAALSGLSFSWTPQLVLIKRENNTNVLLYWHAGLVSGESFTVTATAALTTGIKSVGAASVTLGTDGAVNTSGSPYNGVALYSPDGAHLRTGSYTGNASDGRDISIGDTWTPDFVNVKRGATSVATMRTSEHSGDSSQSWNGLSGTNRIQAFGAGTFQVGTDVTVNANSGNTDYYWFALRDYAAVMETFTYAGDTNDNRDIATLGFTPDAFVATKGINQNAAGMVRFAGHTGDESQNINGSTSAGIIQAFITNGIQVGNSGNANSSGATYAAFALKANVTPPATGKPYHAYAQQ